MSYQLSNVNNTICSNSEVESNFFIFEIKVSNFNDDTDIYRKISYKNEGILLDVDNNIKKIKITMCRINNINNLIIIRKHFDTIITKPTILCSDNLVITLDCNDNGISIRYIVV